ncbi:MAG: PDGLE domain-containing protein [Methanobacteriaceae archaeon]|jgi:cobalt/nickel transport protein|nr:PDGLE domain-containing protein [Candidatus Methanorudis spinitermitis]
MDKKTKQLIIGGIIAAILIGVTSAFFASSEPDGLEKSIEEILPEFGEKHLIESPMPDYEIPMFGETPVSNSIAIIAGIIVVFILAYGLGYFVKRRKKK